SSRARPAWAGLPEEPKRAVSYGAGCAFEIVSTLATRRRCAPGLARRTPTAPCHTDQVYREHDGSQSKHGEHVKGGNLVARFCHMMSAADHRGGHQGNVA